MSFTVKVKEELLNLSRFDKSELSAIIKMSGSLGLTAAGLTLSIITENAKVARHIYELIETIYQVQPEIKYHQRTNLRICVVLSWRLGPFVTQSQENINWKFFPFIKTTPKI